MVSRVTHAEEATKSLSAHANVCPSELAACIAYLRPNAFLIATPRLKQNTPERLSQRLASVGSTSLRKS
jgi:hypothetical protein